MKDYLFEIIDENSDYCGEQFFVECESLREAWETADVNFPDVALRCYGSYSIAEAEMMGLDTY